MTETTRLGLKNSQGCTYKKIQTLNKNHRELYIFIYFGIITNYLKLSGLKHHSIYYLRVSVGQESGRGVTGSTDQSFTSLSGNIPGKNPLTSSFKLAGFISLWPYG